MTETLWFMEKTGLEAAFKGRVKGEGKEVQPNQDRNHPREA
jgi:hypothetical protein